MVVSNKAESVQPVYVARIVKKRQRARNIRFSEISCPDDQIQARCRASTGSATAAGSPDASAGASCLGGEFEIRDTG